VTDDNKLAAMRAVEGGGAGDAPHKAAIRTALGLDPNPAAANHVAITADVANFMETARLGVLLHGMAGANNDQKLRAVLGRLNVGGHNATTGANVGVVVSPDIDAALTHLGL